MTTPNDVQPKVWSHINGSQEEMLDRFCISELCRGWPVYRDASEWSNYRDLFQKEAYVWTTWSGGKSIDDFIEVSKAGKARGDFIMHRECGVLVDLNASAKRGIGKMKATITQRFNMEGMAFDVDCDCRFIFFVEKLADEGWKTKYVKLFYEKDKMVPTDGMNCPVFPKEELDKYPEGYKYLSVAQNRLGHPILQGSPTLRNEAFKKMYEGMGEWLEGKDIDLFWEKH